MASTSASITLQHLPDELLQLVIENMSAASKKRFSRVNRLMRNLAVSPVLPLRPHNHTQQKADRTSRRDCS